MAVIQYAWYGYHQQVINVTAAVVKLFNSGQRSFPASNSYGGDPSIGNGKTLFILWLDNDNEYCGFTSEGDKTPITIGK
ncbi:hypothetical protein [Burkholderia sp. MSHR3999]|uniref:hypothetical protein n=1 Tax=Burkholderia sp. MSHR3999 TaxID=1542965 RepID=UPI0012E07969|nr:hypothetical protein [Burkholderia sp. MSHR3999]